MALSTFQGFSEHIKNVASSASEATRLELISQLRRLTDSLETENDVIHRIGYLHLQTAAVRTGFNIGLFKYLAAKPEPASLKEISEATGAEYLLLSRLTSYLAAIGVVDETGQYQYSANNITRHLTSDLAEAEISFCFDTCAPLFQHIPPYLLKNGHKSPIEESKTVFQDAWKTDKVAYEWMGAHPDHLVHLNKYMELRVAGAESWLSVYPVQDEAKGFDGRTPLYVNIGGGVGHNNAQFAEKYSHLPGDNVLQDLPASIENALSTPGVRNDVHNFFEEQPIKGAKFYYLRKVLHNHPQHESRKVLERTRDAMGPDSVILIDEIVLPTKGANAYARSLDFTMLAAHAAMERTEALWKELVESAGLKLHKTYLYNAENYESIIDVRLP